MLLPIFLILIALSSLQAARCYIAFRRNLAAAKASGIPYVILPIFPVARFWLTTQALWLPFLRLLPRKWLDSWLPISLQNSGWTLRHDPFRKHGSDTLLLVAPGKCELKTADAAVISQITSRRSDFPKPLEVYGSLMLYGANVVTTEGPIWRAHRKITSPSFSEKNLHMVWDESIFQAQSMMNSWIEAGSKSSVVTTLGEGCMRLSLHIISHAGFGQRLQWPTKHEATENSEKAQMDGAINSDRASKEHTLSYSDTLIALLENVIWILLVPKPVLKRLPFKKAKVAYQAFIEWGIYLRELYEAKKMEVASASQQEAGLDLMGALVKGGANLEKGEEIMPHKLTESDILGNAFVFILAGHETTANSIHFSIIYLALHLSAQRALQADLDRIFAKRSPSQWDYEIDLPALINSMANAVLSEQLRLISPVVAIPKCVRDQPQPLTVNGKKCTVPAGTYVSIVTAAVHRNPNYWPAGPPSDPGSVTHPQSNTDNDLEQFKPERWLNASAAKGETGLYRPRHGAYIPFSEGARSCLGRRFAQVEVLAVLAVIFTQYSVELALDEGETWDQARDKVHKMFRENMVSIFTLKLAGCDAKVRFVRRERGG